MLAHVMLFASVTAAVDPSSAYCNDLLVGLANRVDADRVVLPTDASFATSVQQYAYSSLPAGAFNPSGVVYAKTTDEVQQVVAYASKCGYRVVVRSGGHQYSGLSSCNSTEHKCVQLDMSGFDSITIRGDIVTVGAGISLRRLYATLAAEGMFVAGGECSEVFLGGHAQTGGSGPYSRSFGYVADNVVSFEIVLADGEVKTVTRPLGVERAFSINDRLFWAALGGNAGSWGAITSYVLRARHDAAYPHSTYYTCATAWTPAAYKAAAKVIDEAVTSGSASWPMTSAGDEAIFLTALKRVPADTNILYLKGVWSGVTGAAFNNATYVKFQQALMAHNISTVTCSVAPVAPSVALRDHLTFYGNREFPFPFMKSVQGMKGAIGDAALDIMAQGLDSVMSVTSGVYPVHQIATFGGAMNTPTHVAATGLPHRDLSIVIGWASFYSVGINPAAKETSENFMWGTWDNIFAVEPFAGRDYRVGWGTFKDVRIENSWQYFWDENTYAKLRDVKSLVDPNDVFRTKFTIPPVGRSA